MNWMWQRLEFDEPAIAPAAMRHSASARPLSRTTKSQASSLHIELRSLISCRAITPQWQELAGRAVEANIFAEADIMVAAAHHLPARHAPAALVVFANNKPGAKLLALVPLETARMPLLPDAMRGYVTPYHPVGVPLIDKTHAVAVLRAIFNWMAEQGHQPGTNNRSLGASGMLWKHVPLDGAFAHAVAQAASSDLRQVDILEKTRRPILTPPAKTSGRMPASLPSKLRSDLERRRRRLADHGEIRFVETSSGSALRDAVETYMILEASSWKGRRGTALVQNARTSCFIRAASRMMSLHGHFNVLTLHSGDVPIAAAITLEANARSWAYKIAYDDAFAKMSPGLILAAEFCRRQQAKPAGHITDSCMDEPNPILAQLWNDEANYGDLLVATTPGKTPGAIAMRMRERFRRYLRSSAKIIYRKAMGYTR